MNRIRSRRSIQCVLAVILGMVTAGSDLLGQGSGPLLNVFPPAPRSLRQNLLRAKKAIEEERFSDAVAELGVILTGRAIDNPEAFSDEHQDFFIEDPDHVGTQTSIKAEAQRLLGTMPPRGRELFELQFGADARALLDQAVRTADINQLNEVVRRYFHTTAGYEAALLLGRIHYDHGRPLAAALSLQRVANVPAVAARMEPELSLLSAACWQLARQPERAQSSLAGLDQRQPRGAIRLGDSDVRELPPSDSAAGWLGEHFRGIATFDGDASQWPLYRGNPARNANREGGLPLRRSRWQVRLVVDEHDQQLIEEVRSGFVEQRLPMLPVVHPLAMGNIVVLRSSERLVGIDFGTGKRVWEYPWWDLGSEEQADRGNPMIPPQNARDDRMATLRERLWQDVPFGQVSSDGQAVYLLDGMSPLELQTQQLNPRIGWNRGPRMAFPMQPAMMRNELVALDLQREGYMLWKVGGDTGDGEPKLAGAFFLGPPLPLFGSLYLVAELKGELRLVVLDAATGRQQWSQQLAHLESLWGIDEHVRRYSGATPSFADGVLICPTSAGAIVAVDVATRTLLWGYQYASERDNLGRRSFIQPFQVQPLSNDRWQDSSITIAEGSVLVTPVESNMLICLDLLTGQPRWDPLPRSRQLAGMLYVAGVHQGKAVLVGKDQIVAIRLSDGQMAWKEPVHLQEVDGELPSGRGVLCDDHFYLPTTRAELLKVDLREGKIVARTATDHVLGNLISFGGDIVSVAADRAATFYQVEPLRKRVEAQLAQNPNDAWGLARLGELLVHDGRTGEALTALRRAHSQNPQDEGVRSLLVDTFLAALEQDFDQHESIAEEVSALIDNEPQRAKYLTLVAAGFHRRGNLAAATEHYGQLLRLTALAAAKNSGRDAFAMIKLDQNATVRADRFLAARLHELSRAGDESVRQHIDELVTELGSQARAAQVADLRRYLQFCGFHQAADPQRLLMASNLIESGDLLEAELILGPVVRRGTIPAAGQAHALLSRIYSAAKKPQALAATYQLLREKWADVPVLDGKTGRQLADEALPLQLDYPLPSAAWPWGMVTASDARDSQRQTFYSVHPMFPILQRRGGALDHLYLDCDFQRNCALRDGNGTAVVTLPQLEARAVIDTGLWQTSSDGHLLFAAIAGQLLALDALQPRANEIESALWRDTLLGTERETANPQVMRRTNPLDPTLRSELRWADSAGRLTASVGPMTAGGVCYQKIRAIHCVDPLQGTMLWSRSDFEPGSEMFGDEELVFIEPPLVAAGRAGTTVGDKVVDCTVLSAVDGRTLDKRRLPPWSNRWTVRGRNILAWEQQPAGIRVFLQDAFQQADLWSENCTASARGCLIDNDAVAVLEPDGRLFIRSLTDGTELLRTVIEPTANLASIEVLESVHQYLVIVNEAAAEAAPADGRRRVNPQILTPVNGRIFALDRQTGRSLWPVPAIVEDYYLLPRQPAEVPSLWLVRLRQPARNQSNSASEFRVDVLCLDRRTGAAILERNEVANHINAYDLVADARKREVTLALPQTQLTVRFTDEPAPPAPPFQHARGDSRLTLLWSRFGNIVESVKDVFAPPTPNDPFK